jgi:hypothetical protein
MNEPINEPINDYWNAVLEILQDQYKLNFYESNDAVSNFRAKLKENEIGEIIYHVAIEETANGIMSGGYYKK